MYGGSYFLWMCLLLYLSLRPDIKGPGIEIPYFDKIAHLGFYFVASFLFLYFIERTSLNKLCKTIKVFINLFFHMLLGGLIEFTQHYYVSGRSGEIEDFFANSIGVVVGIFLYYSRWSFFSRSN